MTERGDLERSLYRTMVTIREFEIAVSQLLARGAIPGFLHLSIGQEAVAAGACAALRPSDRITSTHRGHGHCIAKGGDLGLMMAELFGRAAGYGKGRGGSMHIADAALGILGANGIVGGGLPMAVGAGYAARVRGEDRVTVAFFGEGAVAEGTFHEALNVAALWGLPVVFLCENNLYAEMSRIDLHLKSPDVAAYAAPHGIPGLTVDGNDALAVYQAASGAVERARHEGPSLVECKTYRWRGHFEGDPQRYRTPDEVEDWKRRDPIDQLGRRLIESRLATEAELERIQAETRERVSAAARAAEAAPLAGPALVTEDVYARGGDLRRP